MEPTELCGHRYTTLGRRIFSCDKPLANHGRGHYYVRNTKAEELRDAANVQGQLILTPGERRG